MVRDQSTEYRFNSLQANIVYCESSLWGGWVDLNTIAEIARTNPQDGTIDWREGDAWLAGGTWLFSELQPHLRRLIDIQGFGWPPLTISKQGVEIAATCRIAELVALVAPPDWTAAALIEQCCRSFLSSFKIWNTATVGGNICLSLPAGPMISLTVALEGICRILLHDGGERLVAVEDFVTGNNKNVLQPGDLLRSIELPASALRKRSSFRQMSLTHLGRSTALLVGTLDPQYGVFMLAVSASTERPYRFKFPKLPGADELRTRIQREIPRYFDDVHGTPDYRQHLTLYFAEEIRREVSNQASA
jgi:CO/xanthine dehydrogenase FAD-binding subunit